MNHQERVHRKYLTLNNNIYRMVVAYRDEERLIGDPAVNQLKSNFKNSIQFFNRYLGLNVDCVDQLKEEEKFITYKIVPMEGKKIGIEVFVRGT